MGVLIYNFTSHPEIIILGSLNVCLHKPTTILSYLGFQRVNFQRANRLMISGHL